jgi:hypothetical protein
MSSEQRSCAEFAWRRWSTSLLVLGGALALGCADDGGEHAPGVRIPVEWAQARRVKSHQSHVGKRKIECSKCHALERGELGGVRQERCTECHEGEAEIVHSCGPGEGSAWRARWRELPRLPRIQPRRRPRSKDRSLSLGLPAMPRRKASGRRAGGRRAPFAGLPQLPPAARQATGRTDQLPRVSRRSEREPTPRKASRPSGCAPPVTCRSTPWGRPPTGSAPSATPNRSRSFPPRPPSPADTRRAQAATAPHDFRRENVVSCRSCHEDRPVLGGGRIAQHAACNSCHRPHDVKADPSGACIGCHGAGKTDHPKAKGRASPCTSCHDPHPGNAVAAKPRACSSCHSEGPGRQGLPRQGRGVHRVPRAASLYPGQSQHGHLRPLSHRAGLADPAERGASQVRRVPCGAASQARPGEALRGLPREARGAGEPRPRGLPALSRAAQHQAAEALRRLPCPGTPAGARRPQAVHALPRRPHRRRQARGLRPVPRGRAEGTPREGGRGAVPSATGPMAPAGLQSPPLAPVATSKAHWRACTSTRGTGTASNATPATANGAPSAPPVALATRICKNTTPKRSVAVGVICSKAAEEWLST